ncbi:I78 family peptidase inhibitor [Aidingimonas lacisalsi]|uniref:I78 family peptidase inhibitor n=1 Tax=Aidingimonas lacisalsi TaxID=2604086 RepID=UPI001EEF245F|nr:I78 family peptidase inhibitor [Aidingimonas lacisalsi]
MRTLRTMLLVTLSSTLIACGGSRATSSPEPDDAPPPPQVSDSGQHDPCGAAPVQDRVGRQFSDALERAIAEESDAERVRVLRPGEAATLDHRPDRLNIRLDDDNAIVDIACG